MQLLSSLMVDVSKARQGRFLREFRSAVIAGELDAVEVAERIKLSPVKKGGKVRETADFAVISSPEVVKVWTERTAARMTTKSRATVPSWKDIQNGVVEPQKAAEQTRQKLKQTRERGAKQAAKRKTDTAQKTD